MATAITRYLANDGTEFATAQEADNHNDLIQKINAALAPLGSVPQRVQDGKGWVQHSERAYRAAHRALVKLALLHFKGCDKLFDLARMDPDKVHPMGVAGRIINDSAPRPLDRAWGRLRCIDSTFREHQQPFFALNGPDSDHVCVEDRR